MARHYQGINTRYTISFDYFKIGEAYQFHIDVNKFIIAIVTQLTAEDITFKYFEPDEENNVKEIHMTVEELMHKSSYEITKMKPDYLEGRFSTTY